MPLSLSALLSTTRTGSYSTRRPPTRRSTRCASGHVPTPLNRLGSLSGQCAPARRFPNRTCPSTTSPSRAIRLRVRRLREDDRSLVQDFDFGSARYEGDVGRFVKKWIWADPPDPP